MYIERNPNITILQISLKISKLFKGLSKFEYVGAIAGFITLKIAVILIERYSTN